MGEREALARLLCMRICRSEDWCDVCYAQADRAIAAGWRPPPEPQAAAPEVVERAMTWARWYLEYRSGSPPPPLESMHDVARAVVALAARAEAAHAAGKREAVEECAKLVDTAAGASRAEKRPLRAQAIDRVAALLRARREAVEECIGAICPLCLNGVRLANGKHGKTGPCPAQPIRALAAGAGEEGGNG